MLVVYVNIIKDSYRYRLVSKDMPNVVKWYLATLRWCLDKPSLNICHSHNTSHQDNIQDSYYGQALIQVISG